MGLLTKQDIMNADDRPTEDVECPEWGGTVRVRALSGRLRGIFEQSLVVGEGKNRRVDTRDSKSTLVALSAVDENGARIFTDDEMPGLVTKSAAALERVAAVCQRLSGLSTDAVEKVEKNSAPDLKDSSPSSSASSSESPTPTSSSTA